MSKFTTSQLAEKTNVNIATVRYYEKRGLITEPPRTETGYRLFGQEAIDDIKMIKQAQELGFTLEEIKMILAIYKNDDYYPTEEMYQLSKVKIIKIEEQIARLTKLKELLEFPTKCPSSKLPLPKESCPLLRRISEGEEEK